jgi:type II secretory pathway component PulF
VIFMLTFVMPRLMNIFLSIEQDLPIPTRILISISSALRQWWPWLLFGAVFLIVILRRQIKTRAGMLILSQFYLHLPVFGRFITKAELARFCRTLELLVKNGIPILRALEVATPVLDNEVIKEHLQKSYKELEQGGSLGKSLKGCSFIPVFMSNLISVGEESGRLDEALGEVADIYERDTDEAIKVLSSLLEPMMILVMGLVVGFIVVAMLLPLFEINIMMK